MLPEGGASHCASSDQEDARSDDNCAETTLPTSESSTSLRSDASAPGLDIIYREPSWQKLGSKPRVGEQQLIPVLRSKNKNQKLLSNTGEKVALYSNLPDKGQENNAAGQDKREQPPKSSPRPVYGPKNPNRLSHVQDRPKSSQPQSRDKALSTLSSQDQNAVRLSRKVYKPTGTTGAKPELAAGLDRWRDSRQQPTKKPSTAYTESRTKQTTGNASNKPDTNKVGNAQPRENSKLSHTSLGAPTRGSRTSSPREAPNTQVTKLPKVASQKPSPLPDKKPGCQQKVAPKVQSSIPTPTSTVAQSRSNTPQPSSRASSKSPAVRDIRESATRNPSRASTPDTRGRTIGREIEIAIKPQNAIGSSVGENPSEDGDQLREDLTVRKRRTTHVRRSVIELQESKRLVSSSSFLLKDSSSRTGSDGCPSQSSSRQPSRRTSDASSISTSISRTSRPPTRMSTLKSPLTKRTSDVSKRTPNRGTASHSRKMSLTYKSPAGAAMNVPRATPVRNKDMDVTAVYTPVPESKRTRPTRQNKDDMRLSGVTAVDGTQTCAGSSALPTPLEDGHNGAQFEFGQANSAILNDQPSFVMNDVQVAPSSTPSVRLRPRAQSSPGSSQGLRDPFPAEFSQLLSSAFMGGNATLASMGQMATSMGYMPVLAFVDPRMCYPMQPRAMFTPAPLICPCHLTKTSTAHQTSVVSRNGDEKGQPRDKISEASTSDTKHAPPARPTTALEKPAKTVTHQTPLPKTTLVKGTPLTTEPLVQSESVRAALSFMGIGPKNSEPAEADDAGNAIAVYVDEESEYLKSPSEGRSRLPVAAAKMAKPQPLTFQTASRELKQIENPPSSPLRIKASLTSSAIAAKIAALQDAQPSVEAESPLAQSSTQVIANPDRSLKRKPLASRSMSRLQALSENRRKRGADAAVAAPKLPVDQANAGARRRDLRKQATDSARKVRDRLANMIHTNGKFDTMQGDGAPRRVDSLANTHIRDRLPTFTVEELKFLSSI